MIIKLLITYLITFGKYLMLMGRTFSRPERMRMFFKQYVKEMSKLGVMRERVNAIRAFKGLVAGLRVTSPPQLFQ